MKKKLLLAALIRTLVIGSLSKAINVQKSGFVPIAIGINLTTVL